MARNKWIQSRPTGICRPALRIMALVTGKLPAMAAIAIVLCGTDRTLGGKARRIEAGENRLQAVLVTPSQATATQIKKFAADRFNAVVLYLDEKSPSPQRRAAAAGSATGLDLSYWIEVARNHWPTHQSGWPFRRIRWRRFFPGFPALASITKTYRGCQSLRGDVRRPPTPRRFLVGAAGEIF